MHHASGHIPLQLQEAAEDEPVLALVLGLEVERLVVLAYVHGRRGTRGGVRVRPRELRRARLLDTAGRLARSHLRARQDQAKAARGHILRPARPQVLGAEEALVERVLLYGAVDSDYRARVYRACGEHPVVLLGDGL